MINNSDITRILVRVSQNVSPNSANETTAKTIGRTGWGKNELIRNKEI